MALMKSSMVPLVTPAEDFSLPGTDGSLYDLKSFKDKKVLVIIIMCNYCPYVKAVLGRLRAIQNDYRGKGVQLVGINPNNEEDYPEDSMENMKKLVDDGIVNYPYLRDDSQETAKRYDAVCTPDLYLYGPERRLLYRGRIDDNWQDESGVKERDLRNAIEAVLSGEDVPAEQHPSMGCSIKWK